MSNQFCFTFFFLHFSTVSYFQTFSFFKISSSNNAAGLFPHPSARRRSSVNIHTETRRLFITSDFDKVMSNSHLSEAVDSLATRRKLNLS